MTNKICQSGMDEAAGITAGMTCSIDTKGDLLFSISSARVASISERHSRIPAVSVRLNPNGYANVVSLRLAARSAVSAYNSLFSD